MINFSKFHILVKHKVMLKVNCITIMVALFLFLNSTLSAFTMMNLTQWKIEDGGNDHWYSVVDERLNWNEATTFASSLSNGANNEIGYLASITSEAENQFLFGTILNGIYDPLWDNQSQLLLGGYWNGSNWAWTTGEGFGYTHWSAFEPNSSSETVISMWGADAGGDTQYPGFWNDTRSNFALYSIVEWGTNYNYAPEGSPPISNNNPVPEPTTILLFLSGFVCLIISKKGYSL